MHGDFVYLEFSLDPNHIEETLRFYHELFQWTFRESFLSSKKYVMFETPSKILSGGFDENTTSSTIGVQLYIDCDDIDHILEVIETHFIHSQIIKRKTLISKDFGSYAFIIDPSGNRIGLQQSPSKEN